MGYVTCIIDGWLGVRTCLNVDHGIISPICFLIYCRSDAKLIPRPSTCQPIDQYEISQRLWLPYCHGIWNVCVDAVAGKVIITKRIFSYNETYFLSEFDARWNIHGEINLSLMHGIWVGIRMVLLRSQPSNYWRIWRYWYVVFHET